MHEKEGVGSWLKKDTEGLLVLAVHRRPDFVAAVGQELGFSPVCIFGGLLSGS